MRRTLVLEAASSFMEGKTVNDNIWNYNGHDCTI